MPRSAPSRANGLPSVTAEESFTLRNPKVNPHSYDKFSDVNKMAFGGNRLVIPSKSGSFIALNQIDLAGINEVEFMAIAPKAQVDAAGGVIELHIDSPTGTLVGKSDFIGDNGGGFAPKPVTVKVAPTQGPEVGVTI